MPRPASAADVVAAVRRLAGEPRPETVWIGIDGRGASGKTTLADRVAAAVPEVDVLHVDDFSGPRCATWDKARFRAQVLDPLLAGRGARYQVWDWGRDAGAQWVDIRPGRLLVVEGVSSTAAELPVPWALRVWVDAPRQLRLARALARDGEAMLARWLDDWMPSEEAYIAAEHPERQADLIVEGWEPGSDLTR